MNIDRNNLDRHITGNHGEDSVASEWTVNYGGEGETFFDLEQSSEEAAREFAHHWCCVSPDRWASVWFAGEMVDGIDYFNRVCPEPVPDDPNAPF